MATRTATVKFEDVRLYLSDPRIEVRGSLRMALHEAGLKSANIREGTTPRAVEMAVADPQGVDVLICDVTEDTDDFCKLFNAIRHNELGNNPFICIIAVAWSPKQPLVAKVVDSGADLLVAAPISPGLILDRIASLVHARKPFVVTSDYVGPDRRLIDDRETEVPLIEVPNSLRDKALGQFDPAKLKMEIEATRADINGQKIDRAALQLTFLADMVADDSTHAAGRVEKERLRQLVKVTNDLRGRAAKAGAKELEEICLALREVLQRMAQAQGHYTGKDSELLNQLALAVRTASKSGNKSGTAAHDITETVMGLRASA